MRAHVFAIDWIPDAGDIATGGGLRSLQIANALRDGGHDVTLSFPRDSSRVQALLRADPDRMRTVLLHDANNQIELLQHTTPEVILWLWPSLRNVPMFGKALHVNDLNGIQHYEIANGSKALLKPSLDALLRRCRGIDLVLTGSPEQNGFWASLLAQDGQFQPSALVPYSLPSALRGGSLAGESPLRRLHFSGNLYSWNLTLTWLHRVAAWCDRQRDVELHVIAGLDPGGGTDLSSIAQLRALQAFHSVRLTTAASFHDVVQAYQPGSVSLDLYEDTLERRLAVPIRTANALLHGVPLLTNIDSSFTRSLLTAGAALLTDQAGEDRLDFMLDSLVQMTPQALAAMSSAATAFAERAFSETMAARSLLDGINRAARSRHLSAARWASGGRPARKIGHVLTITDESPNLRELRLAQPFSALHREGLIDGYSIWSRNEIVFSTRAAASNPAFDAIWVQRRLLPHMAIALEAVGQPFVFDVDDNLLVSPGYRESFSPEVMQASRFLARTCAVLTTSNARLGELIQTYASSTLIDKIVVCPNLAAHLLPAPTPGPPRCVIWASSDTPALIGGQRNIVRAIRDFCQISGLKLVCMGAQPHALLLESGIEIEHMGLLPYGEYLAYLNSMAPAIMVCPLETDGDPATQDFVDGKSDIKILETLITGVVGVFSAARPYLETDLPPPIICDNSYRSWFDGLMRASEACLVTMPHDRVPQDRLRNPVALRPWVEALSRVELSRPLLLSDLQSALALTSLRYKHRLLPEHEFDESVYLAQNPDVRSAVNSGEFPSAYHHYLHYGFRERRSDPNVSDLDAHDQFWLNLKHTVSDLRRSIENRVPELEQIRTRRASRIKLRQLGRR